MEIGDLVLVSSKKETEKYLLTELFKQGLRIPKSQQADFEKLVRNELMAFGGNFFNLEDQKRASIRALKFINLGLERSSVDENKMRDGSDDLFDEQFLFLFPAK